jgi:hypothetical protein
MELKDVWQTLEQTASAMENGEGNWPVLVATAQESIRLLFNFQPRQILQKAEHSQYPTKPLIKWLLHEGQKINGIGADSLQELCSYWNENMGKEKGTITFPPIA